RRPIQSFVELLSFRDACRIAAIALFNRAPRSFTKSSQAGPIWPGCCVGSFSSLRRHSGTVARDPLAFMGRRLTVDRSERICSAKRLASFQSNFPHLRMEAIHELGSEI